MSRIESKDGSRQTEDDNLDDVDDEHHDVGRGRHENALIDASQLISKNALVARKTPKHQNIRMPLVALQALHNRHQIVLCRACCRQACCKHTRHSYRVVDKIFTPFNKMVLDESSIELR